MSLWVAFVICALIGIVTGIVNSVILYFTYRDRL